MKKFKLLLKTGLEVEVFAGSSSDAINYVKMYYGVEVVSCIHIRSKYDIVTF